MLIPALKPGQDPALRPDGAVWVGAHVYGHLTELEDESGLVWPLCGLMDGTKSTDSLVEIMVADHGATADQVYQILDLFRDRGWLVDHAAPVPAALTAQDLERHSRTLEFLTNIDTSPRTNPYELLSRLRTATATVIGLGGVGSAVTSALVATGIGHLHCVDFDCVELSNLNRQLLFTEKDLGRAKVEVVAERLQALDSSAAVTIADMKLGSAAEVASVIVDADVVFCCADSPAEFDDWANEACFAAGVPWLTASYFGAKYSLATYIPGRTGCYACLKARHLEHRYEFGMPTELKLPDFHGVLAASAQIAGHFMALEGVYLLLGMPVQTAGRELHRHLTDYEHYYFLEAEPRPDCPVRCSALLERE
ncbi:MAG TPA: ThiF family adenylyltransferase [Streptosporangiaceae bacterium]